MVEERIRKRLPPYVSYQTFRTFLTDLVRGIPSRIDHSYWGNNLSGSTRTQLMSALLFLSLVDGNGMPTNRLKLLVAAKDVKRTDILKQTCNDAYNFVFQSTFDIQTGTYAQLQEMFHSTFQISSSVSRKCIKFFVAMASDAGIPLSPYITKQTRTRSGTISKITAKKSLPRIGRNLPMAQDMEEVPGRMTWDKLLLNKFPSFDPSWPDELKVKWFQAFDELLRRGLNNT
jgi:hypothetical protein